MPHSLRVGSKDRNAYATMGSFNAEGAEDHVGRCLAGYLFLSAAQFGDGTGVVPH